MSEIIPSVEKWLREIIQDHESKEGNIEKELRHEIKVLLHDLDYDEKEVLLILKGLQLAKEYPILLNFVHFRHN